MDGVFHLREDIYSELQVRSLIIRLVSCIDEKRTVPTEHHDEKFSQRHIKRSVTPFPN